MKGEQDNPDVVGERIEEVRRSLGARLLILGHHYQRPAVLRHADAIGDSLELSKQAAAHPEADRIVFCGVRFMAESASILAGPSQSVYMPDPAAGCPMADMADAEGMLGAWECLESLSSGWAPVVYVNSSAAVKACCGRLGGSCCTSSNAARVVRRALDRGKRVFFLPDEHLGVNTAFDLGIPDERVFVCDPRSGVDALRSEQASRAQMVVWKGFCIVHVAFTVEHVRGVRETMPDAKIIVHPETPREVLRLADAHGSTSQIIEHVKCAQPGSTVVIGTESHLVERLADEFRGRVNVKALAPSICSNMAKTTLRGLLDLLTGWQSEREIRVPAETARDARLALAAMLSA